MMIEPWQSGTDTREPYLRTAWAFLVLAGVVATGGSLSAGTASAARTQGSQQPPAQPAPAVPAQDSAPKAASDKLLVPSGTRLPLILHNAVTTRNARPGDPVYLETLFRS